MPSSEPVTVWPREASRPASDPIAVPAIATKWTCTGARLLRERFADQIVHLGAQRELAALGDQVDAVGEQRDRAVRVEVDAERGAGEAQVSDRLGREVRAGRGALRSRCVPAERPIRAGRELLARGELAQARAREGLAAAVPDVEQ